MTTVLKNPEWLRIVEHIASAEDSTHHTLAQHIGVSKDNMKQRLWIVTNKHHPWLFDIEKKKISRGLHSNVYKINWAGWVAYLCEIVARIPSPNFENDEDKDVLELTLHQIKKTQYQEWGETIGKFIEPALKEGALSNSTLESIFKDMMYFFGLSDGEEGFVPEKLQEHLGAAIIYHHHIKSELLPYWVKLEHSHSSTQQALPE